MPKPDCEPARRRHVRSVLPDRLRRLPREVLGEHGRRADLQRADDEAHRAGERRSCAHRAPGYDAPDRRLRAGAVCSGRVSATARCYRSSASADDDCDNAARAMRRDRGRRLRRSATFRIADTCSPLPGPGNTGCGAPVRSPATIVDHPDAHAVRLPVPGGGRGEGLQAFPRLHPGAGLRRTW